MGIEILTDQELRRYNNQIQLSEIGVKGQESLKNANIAVVGSGGLGASVLKYLAAIGVGRLGIIDYTLVEESNIQRQTIYGGNDLGKLKTIITKQHLQELFPLVNFDIINLEINEENALRILKPFDIVIDATNYEPSNTIINEACARLNITCVYGTVLGFKGIVATINAQDKFPIEKLLAHKNLFFKKEIDLKNNNGIALTYGLVGNILALEVIKILTFSPKSLIGKYLTIDTMSMEFQIHLA